MLKFALLLTLLSCLHSTAVEPPAVAAPAAVPATEVPLADDGIRVSVLGYHDLSENLPETAMRIRTAKFRKQMQAIRELGLKVITIEQFTAWKKNGTPIPNRCMLITFDDGWKSVYTEAFPVLRELGFPYTIFLYKDYVDGGGRALTTQMIQEMKAAGGLSIGSHSVTHPYPLTVKNSRKKGPNVFDAFLRKEMGESKYFLESKFPLKINSYAYPGGFFTEEMFKLGNEFGYDFMFTVVPGKVKRSLSNETLPRNIILGNYDKLFEIATTFREGPSATAAASGAPQVTPYPVTPAAGAVINSRLPEISADLSKVPNLDPKTLSMKIGGFGEVPAIFTATTKKFSWTVNRRLRQPTCQVIVSWKDTAGKPVELPLRWSFQLDLDSAYLPDEE
jgi:peptidoglycan/xylan/chitin deacetylase (PgdA/CDA1 family)